MYKISENIKDQISPDNVIKFVKYYLEELEREGITLFQGSPTVEAFPKRKNLIGLSLIDDNNTGIKYKFDNEPRFGKDYLFIRIDELNEENFIKRLAESYAYRKSDQIGIEDAYQINLQRVENLLPLGQYAAALVFLVSAIENITKDLFFVYSNIWFSREDDKFDKIVYEKIGVKINNNVNNSFILDFFSEYRIINNQKIGIEKTKEKEAREWDSVVYWEKIHKICKKLGIYNEYILKKQGNEGKEIGRFEILRELLEKRAREMRIMNFQRIFKPGGIVYLYKEFFNIDLTSFRETLNILNKAIKKRHKIVHGLLRDDQIDEIMITDLRPRISKLVLYLEDELNLKYRENLYFFYL